MRGSAAIQPEPKDYSLSVVPQSYLINAAGPYSFTFTTTDLLLSSAVVTITFPP